MTDGALFEENRRKAEIVCGSGIVSDWSLAIDGGAHLGSWTLPLSERFDVVVAFEPSIEAFSQLAKAVAPRKNVTIRNEALFDVAGRVQVNQPDEKHKRLTSRYVTASKLGPIRAVRVDDLNLKRCGLIKLDLEGAELLAIRGATKTIECCRLVIVVEVSPLMERYGYTQKEAHRTILDMGYREAMRIGMDRIYAPTEL